MKKESNSFNLEGINRQQLILGIKDPEFGELVYKYLENNKKNFIPQSPKHLEKNKTLEDEEHPLLS